MFGLARVCSDWLGLARRIANCQLRTVSGLDRRFGGSGWFGFVRIGSYSGATV